MRSNKGVKKWTKKIKRKKAISLQQNLAVIMSSTVAAVLSEHTAVPALTCLTVILKVAADLKYV